MTRAIFEAKIASSQAMLARAVAQYAPLILTTSFGAEDMVLLDMIASAGHVLTIATLDTGRLPPQTYELWALASEKYRRKIEAFFPVGAQVEQWVRINGINGFYDSVAQRKDCCHLRKVEPLGRALAGKKGWITGLRHSQSADRSALEPISFDAQYQLHKINPLLDWSRDDVWEYLRAFDVPYNALHDLGYPSIGCAPCTREVRAGEDERAGRWWWESTQSKECGLHIHEEVVLP